MSNIPEQADLDNLRYPIGKYCPPEVIDKDQRALWIRELDDLPGRLRREVVDLDDPHLDTPYREGGWTARQVVHHVADSHINSYARFRLALTEDTPAIKAYEEAAWAELKDAKSAQVELSLVLLDALHRRWVILLRSMTDADFARSFVHPQLGELTLAFALGLYAWHGQHHLAHVSNLRARSRW